MVVDRKRWADSRAYKISAYIWGYVKDIVYPELIDTPRIMQHQIAAVD
jgi:hypothetical protein